MLCVRKAEISEIPAVMQFIAEHWKKDHILAVDRDFFEWMYVQGEELNFNLAVDDETGEIVGINGFILYNHEVNPDMSGSMWKVLPNQSPALGLSLGEYSLLSHVNSGKYWGLNKKRGGLYIFPPYINDASPSGEYASVMDGLRGTLGFLKKAKEKYVLLGRSYVICNADFQDMLDKHIKSGADIKIGRASCRERV